MSETPLPAFPNSTFPKGLTSASPWHFGLFEPLTYIYFNIAFVIIAYPLYRTIAGVLKWELTDKRPAKHFSDMMALVRYGFIVFVLGGYESNFNWIVILSFYLAMYIYGLIAEIPFAKQSLITWRNWSIKMWILLIVEVCLILAMAGVHIYLAVHVMEVDQFREKEDVFIAWYLGCLVIPLVLMALAYVVNSEQNTQFLSKFFFNLINKFKSGSTPGEQPQPYGKAARIHLHHWQIFYTLAFFTRFSHPVSQIAGGITLGIYTQGMAAYGPDNFIEEVDH